MMERAQEIATATTSAWIKQQVDDALFDGGLHPRSVSSLKSSSAGALMAFYAEFSEAQKRLEASKIEAVRGLAPKGKRKGAQ